MFVKMFVNFIIILVFLSSEICCFNFDKDSPMIYNDSHKHLNTVTERNPYYGYSVILFSGLNGQRPWIQVGSPFGEDLSLPVKTPGTIFRCPIGQYCKQITVDHDAGNIFNYKNFNYSPRLDGAFIGGSMDIDENANATSVCGHRWIQKNSKLYFIQGICYYSTIDDTHFKKLLPIHSPRENFRTIHNKQYYNYAHGQAGISSHFTTINGKSGLMLGASGVLNWAGTSMIYEKNGDKYGRIRIVDPYQLDDFTQNALYGYSVTSGNYFDKTKMLYTMSSTTANKYFGGVTIFDFPIIGSLVSADVKYAKRGSQMGECFGASLSSGDLNGDGYSDLIIGAPHYKRSLYSEGKVYVLYGNKMGPFQNTETVLYGKSAGSLFGLAVAYLSDFDRDGFGDLVVGAPYEDGAGSIYIYKGSSNGIVTEPSQIITGKKWSLRGFGISFSKLTDIDGNSYGDLAVGSFISGNALILRARPVVHLRQLVTVFGNKFQLSTTDLELCLWYEGTIPDSINVSRTFTIDENEKRVRIPGPEVVKTVTLLRGERSCTNYTAIGNVKTVTNPVVIRVKQELVEMAPAEPYIVGTTKSDSFCRTCPIATKHVSYELIAPFTLECENDDRCISNLQFDVFFKGLSENYVIGSQKYVELVVRVKNLGEKAYITGLTIDLPSYLPLKYTPTICNEQNSSVYCSIGNPALNEVKEFSLELNTEDINNDYNSIPNEIQVNVSVSTSSENLNPVKWKVSKLKMIREADVYLEGKSDQQSYSYGNVSVGKSIFSQTYKIRKDGRTLVDKVTFDVFIPVSLKSEESEHQKNDSTFLKMHSAVVVMSRQSFMCKNLTEVEFVASADDVENLDDSDQFVDTVQAVSTPMLLRRKRQATEVVQEMDGKDDSKEYAISCTKYNCARFQCIAGPFKSSQSVALIKVKGLFNINPFVDSSFSEKDKFILMTDASVKIDFEQIGDKDDSVNIKTLFYGEASVHRVALWVYILSIALGLLLLLLIIFGLTKCGFFNRKKKMELEELKKAEVVEEFETNAECRTSTIIDDSPEDV